MKFRQTCLFLIATALLMAATACQTSPKPELQAAVPPPALPTVRLAEIEKLIDSGSFLQALQDIAWMRREPSAQITTDALSSLESRAIEALSAAFTKSVSEKKYEDALRYLRSALALNRKDIVGKVTEKSLYGDLASSLEASGDAFPSLLARLSVLGIGEASEADLRSLLDAASRLGNHAVLRHVIPIMKSHGFDVPKDAESAAADTDIPFPDMITGMVTIWVNRGIKIEKGVGYPDRIIGSGFFIDSRGYLLTNYHVIKSEVDPKYEGYSRLFIKLTDAAAGEKIPAKVVGYDPIFDLALIKAEITPKYVFSGFGGKKVLPGEKIFAIGSPVGLEKTITSGIVSATGRRFLELGDTLQIDVPVNPGNSGGPLLSEKGDVIGVVFAGMEQYQGINFAIPYNWIEKALPLLYKGGSAAHPWLGMTLSETDKGLEVTYVLPGEPAARAGLRSGDIVEGLDGKAYKKIADIQEALLRGVPPTLVRASIRRDSTSMEVPLCLSLRPDEPIRIALERDSRDPVLYPLFGLKLEKVGSFFWRNEYVVKKVLKGSVADESGFSENDPLTIQDWQVNQEKGYAILQLVIKKRKAGFIESAIQIATYLGTDAFL